MNQDKVNIDNSMTIKFEDTVMVKQEEPKSPKECKQQFTSLCKIIKENGELKSNLEETKSLLLENIRNQMKLIKENGELKVKLKRLESVAQQNCRLKTKFCKVANIVNMVNIELEDYKGKDKKRAIKDSDSDSDSGPDDKGPAKKSAKTSGGSSSCTMGADGEPSWSLGNMKFVKVREFKGKTYIDIREYYVDKQTMETKPGKKGISLNCEQYQKLKSVLSEVDQKLP